MAAGDRPRTAEGWEPPAALRPSTGVGTELWKDAPDGCTTGLAAAAVVALNTGPNDPGQHRTPGKATVNAAQILYLAAAAVETRPAPHPRPHQWSYTKEILYSEQPTSGQIAPSPAAEPVKAKPVKPAKPHTWESWMRFDGTREAGLTPSGRVHVTRLDLDADETTPYEDYRYLASLPTDPKALLDRLCSRRPPYDRSGSECAIIMVDKLARNVAVPPKLLATFYRLLATLPKIQVRENTRDLAGRPALAFSVGRGYMPGLGHLRQAILVDPRTYEYRGQMHTVIPPSTTSPQKRPGARPPGLPLGDHEEVLEASTRLASGILDRPGRRP